MPDLPEDFLDLVRIDHVRWVALCQEMGAALLNAQLFEDALAKYIVIIFKIPPGAALQEAEKILSKTQRQTMGSLIKDLAGRVNMTESTAKLLDEFVEERNWLVHRLQREDAQALHASNPDRFEKLVERVSDVGSRAAHLTSSFGDLFVDWALAQGIPQEVIDAGTRERLRALRGDPPPTPSAPPGE